MYTFVFLRMHIFCQIVHPILIYLSFYTTKNQPNIKKLDIVVQNLKEKLDSKQKEAAAWKAKYNIKTQEEVEASKR